jgi:hypothetical protein
VFQRTRTSYAFVDAGLLEMTIPQNFIVQIPTAC